ncbi:MAG: hypothetical protein MUO99_01335 [Dehalococcoidales bacterium]|nr:hypothetical protein [Dehalococcoidales bacterium]
MIIEEETVRKVIIKYLEKNQAHFKLTKGAGPDIIKEGGIALEVKGSRVKNDLSGALKQLTGYAFAYAELELAIPIDTLSLGFIYSLFGIEAGVHFYSLGRQRSIAIYLVGEITLPDTAPRSYGVYKFSSVKDLLERINTELQSWTRFPSDVNMNETIDKVSKTVIELDERIRNWAQEQLVNAPYLSYKVELE